MVACGAVRRLGILPVMAATFALAACAGIASHEPVHWGTPEALVEPSNFTGVHGLAIDQSGRLLAGSVFGNAIWEVDRVKGSAKIFIQPPEGQADDLAVGPRGELVWTSLLMGLLRMRDSDQSPIRVIAKDLPGINSLGFDRRNGKLYAAQVYFGDALWEIDPRAVLPPRLIAKDLGGLNGFEVGSDGMIYGPLCFKNSVVKVDPTDGTITVINRDFRTPIAAKLDGKGNLWALDTAAGELSRVDLSTGHKKVVQKLNAGLDNLVIAPDGTVYVSNEADNSIQAVNPNTGDVRTLTSGKLAVPSGIKATTDSLLVADLFAFRNINPSSGQVREIKRMDNSDLEYPLSIGVSRRVLVLSSWFSDTVQVVDAQSMRSLVTLRGWHQPYDAQFTGAGKLLVAESNGTLTEVSGSDYGQRRAITSALVEPVQMIIGRDGGLYVTEAVGRLARVDLGDGSVRVVATDLELPEGIAQTPWGTFVIAEAAARRLTEINLAKGTHRVVADKLPIGLLGFPGAPRPYIATGVAVDSAGSVFFSANRNNSVYRVRPLWH
jgi:sugar lactone lactonase YvrE